MNWQSSRVKWPAFKRATSQASATFEASVAVLNMDSPKKARPSFTPYRPPTSRSPCQHSIEWAWPAACSPMTARSIVSLIHVSDRSAQASSTAWKAWSWVTRNRPDRMRFASEWEQWN